MNVQRGWAGQVAGLPMFEAHDAFMTPPPYTSTREGEAPALGGGPQPCQMGLGVSKCSLNHV